MKLDDTAKEKVVKDVTEAITEGLLNNKKGILAREQISNHIHEKMEENRKVISGKKPEEAKPLVKKLEAPSTTKAPVAAAKAPVAAVKTAEENVKTTENNLEAEVKDKIISKLKNLDNDEKLYSSAELKEKVSMAAKHSAEVAINQYK